MNAGLRSGISPVGNVAAKSRQLDVASTTSRDTFVGFLSASSHVVSGGTTLSLPDPWPSSRMPYQPNRSCDGESNAWPTASADASRKRKIRSDPNPSLDFRRLPQCSCDASQRCHCRSNQHSALNHIWQSTVNRGKSNGVSVIPRGEMCIGEAERVDAVERP